jgi:hypothetical protein
MKAVPIQSQDQSYNDDPDLRRDVDAPYQADDVDFRKLEDPSPPDPDLAELAVQPLITPAAPLTPEDGDEPLDEDPTSDPADPSGTPDGDERFKELPPNPGEEPVIR